MLELWPSFLSYSLSYIFVGIVWANHHRLLRYVETAEPAVIGTNLVSLFFVSLIPFFTAYTADSHFEPFTTAVYAAVLLCATVGYVFFEWAITRARARKDEVRGARGLTTWRDWFGLACYASAIPGAYLHPAVSLILIFAVAVVYSEPLWRRR